MPKFLIRWEFTTEINNSASERTLNLGACIYDDFDIDIQCAQIIGKFLEVLRCVENCIFRLSSTDLIPVPWGWQWKPI